MKNWVEKNYFYRNEKSVNHGHFTYKTDGRRMCSEDEVGNILSFYQSYTPIAWFQMSFCAWNQCTIKPVYWRVHLSKENIYIWISRTPTHVRKKNNSAPWFSAFLIFYRYTFGQHFSGLSSASFYSSYIASNRLKRNKCIPNLPISNQFFCFNSGRVCVSFCVCVCVF